MGGVALSHANVSFEQERMMPLTNTQLEARDAARLAEPDPDRIWLEAKCQGLDSEGRCWASEPIDCDDADCGMKSVEYVRAGLMIAESSRLQAIERAARAYYLSYVQDEAESAEDCVCGDEQHEAAKALRDALGCH
jgi:hypothetical protein